MIVAQEPSQDPTHVSCNLCGKDDYAVLFGQGVAQVNQIVKCKGCGLMYANPRYGQLEHAQMKDLESIMDDEEDAGNSEDGWLPGYELRLEKEKLQVRDMEKTLKELREAYPQRGRMLDIGSGFGCLLAKAKEDGWEVQGVEPFAGFCNYGKKHFGIEAFSGVLEEANFPDASFDVITIVHVIEHVNDPVATLKEIYRILKPGGTLVLETPTYDTPSFKLLGRRERSLSCDTHVYFYTLKTLRETLAKLPFEPVRTRRVGRSLTLGRLLWNLAIVSKRKPLIDGVERVSRKLGFEDIWLELNIGDMQRVSVKKPAMA